MKLLRIAMFAVLPIVCQPALSDDLTMDAAIGGGIGGAVGGAVGAEVGGRNGAILGSGIGAAVGTTIATRGSDQGEYKQPERKIEVVYKPDTGKAKAHPHQQHCPPGQAKKGRC